MRRFKYVNNYKYIVVSDKSSGHQKSISVYCKDLKLSVSSTSDMRSTLNTGVKKFSNIVECLITSGIDYLRGL